MSLTFEIRPVSFERNPKIKSETKNVTTTYTNIFNANIKLHK